MVVARITSSRKKAFMPESAPGFLIPSTSRWPLLRRSRRLTGTALLAAILVACGGSDSDSKGEGGNAGGGTDVEVPVDTLASFKQQALNWQACDASFMEERYYVAQLGERVQCALMRVPLDYANPSSAELQIEVLKVSAEQPAQKLGAIVFNPGGPGDGSLSMAPRISWDLTFTQSGEAAPLLRDMSRRYDFVAFSPRGTGRHSPLNCALDEEPLPMVPFIFDDSAENFGNTQHNACAFAESCVANPLTRHIHTEATARDMELLRGLLGEEKLNYAGYSYGSWLGAWYAGLFPERVGRMLFDGATDVTASFEDHFHADALAEQRIIDELMLPYAARNPGRFGLGTDAAALRSRLLALPAKLKKALIETWRPEEAFALNSNIFAIAAVLGLQDLMVQNPQAGLTDLRAGIAASPAFALPQVAEQARELSTLLFDEEDKQEESDEMAAAYWSIRCNDTGTRASMRNYLQSNALAKDFAVRYPLAATNFAYNPCHYWSGPERKMPAVAEASKAGPLLMLQSRYDASTPVEGAMRTWAALPNARMIVVENDYRHGVFPYGAACVDKQVANYFLYGQLPERTSSCPGRMQGAYEYDEGDA